MKRERLDWLADNSRYTRRFAFAVGRRCRSATVKDVAEELDLDWETVKDLDKLYMAEQLRRAGDPTPTVIGIDEISIGPGHSYRIVVSDLERKRPIWFGGHDRSEESMDSFFCWLGPEKCRQIRLAVMDMWKAFRNSTLKAGHAPQARIVFDKFHVLRHLGEAIDKVRKLEYGRLAGPGRRFIKGQKYTLLSRWENLTEKGREALQLLFNANRRLYRAYLLKEQFGELWSCRNAADCSAILLSMAGVVAVAAPRTVSSVRGHDRQALGRHRQLLRTRQPGRARLRRRTQQQDPHHPETSLRLPRRRVPPPQNPDVHPAENCD